MGRKPCCSKVGLKKGAWTVEEDRILKAYITVHGKGKWRSLPTRAGLKRCGKSCRLRWLNYLRPDVKRGNISHEEEDLIIRLHKLLGNKWSLIARRLPGRTDNEIKNYWNTNLRKRIQNKTIIHQSKSCDQAVRSKIKMKPPMVENTLLVQTKAIQCTKMFGNLEQESIKYADKLAVVEASVSKDFATETASQSKPEECSPLRGNYWDFLMDLDVNDAFASEATDAKNSIENCERLIENWISNPVQPDPDLELKAVAAFLDYEEEYFGGEKYDLIGNSASDCVNSRIIGACKCYNVII